MNERTYLELSLGDDAAAPARKSTCGDAIEHDAVRLGPQDKVTMNIHSAHSGRWDVRPMG